jgi:hypothetical protein
VRGDGIEEKVGEEAGHRVAGPILSGAAERAAVRELVTAAGARGEDLTGPDCLLKSITKQVLESARRRR